jgi:hypothetical protein
MHCIYLKYFVGRFLFFEVPGRDRTKGKTESDNDSKWAQEI